MRARHNFTYVIEEIIKPHEIFNFIQEKANLSDYEMYKTFNMGMDYALFVDRKDAQKTLDIIKKRRFFRNRCGMYQEGKKTNNNKTEKYYI